MTATSIEDIEQIVIRDIVEVMRCHSADGITKDTHLNDDLKVDSLDCIEIAMSLESTFKIKVKDKEIDKWVTVGDVMQTVLGRLGH